MPYRLEECPGGHDMFGEWSECHSQDCIGEYVEDSDSEEEASGIEDEVESNSMDHNQHEDFVILPRERNLDLSNLATASGEQPSSLNINDIGKILEGLAQKDEAVTPQDAVNKIEELADAADSSRQLGDRSWNQEMGQQGPSILSSRLSPQSGGSDVQQIIARQALGHTATLDVRGASSQNPQSIRSAPGFGLENIDPCLRQFSDVRSAPTDPQDALNTPMHIESTATPSNTQSAAVFSDSSRTGPTTNSTSPKGSRRRTHSTQSGKRRKIEVYFCGICGKVFETGANGRKHERYHVPQNERPFECDEDNCGKRFVDTKSLRRHKLSHSDVRAFQCNICGKRLKRADAMPRHKKKHR